MRQKLAAISLFSAARGFGSPEIEGAWISDRDLTIASISRMPEISPEEIDQYSVSELFGNSVHIWGKRDRLAIFEGECSPSVSFYKIRRGHNYIDLLVWGPSWLKFAHKRIFLVDEGLAIPIFGGRALEYLRPISISQVLAMNERLTKSLAGLGLDAV